VAFDLNLKDSTHIKISLDDRAKYTFRSVKINVRDPNFYIADGTVPVIYGGTLGNWKGKVIMQDQAYFLQLNPTGRDRFVFLARRATTNENELGSMEFRKDSSYIKLQPQLMEKQIDGVFDSEGFLLYNQTLEKVIYPYRYRNEFIVAYKDLKLSYRGKTIDTIDKAQLDIAKITSKNQEKLGPRSITVTHQATTSGNYLFLSSDRLGRYEPKEMLSQATIIDVYNLKQRTYEFSFYLYNHQGSEMREFIVQGNILFNLSGTSIIKNTFKQEYLKF
jgi:hypothetical protein